MQEIRSEHLSESYTRFVHSSGLTMLLCPMEGFSSAYALFATRYGSVDTCFKTQDDPGFVTVPEGIAHFLEHKLFESEDGDAFSRYAVTGASANAYTSFDRTAYLFSCTENFRDSIEILLDFVTKPYFTQKTVEKEQGIIGQEIRMYEDDAEWRVMFNLLRALYHENPVRIDIAGTIESIAEIDADLLYRCYNTFYNLHNMVLVVAGNCALSDVTEAAAKILMPAPAMAIERKSPKSEPREVKMPKIEQSLPVAQPLFHIGFKGEAGRPEETLQGQIFDETLCDILAGEASPLYRKLYDQGMINATFGFDTLSARDYAVVMFAGESKDPEAVQQALLAEIVRAKKEGLDRAAFARSKKAAWGRYVGMYGKVPSMASVLLSTAFADTDGYHPLEIVAAMTCEQLEERMNTSLDERYCAISIIRSAHATEDRGAQ